MKASMFQSPGPVWGEGVAKAIGLTSKLNQNRGAERRWAPVWSWPLKRHKSKKGPELLEAEFLCAKGKEEQVAAMMLRTYIHTWTLANQGLWRCEAAARLAGNVLRLGACKMGQTGFAIPPARSRPCGTGGPRGRIPTYRQPRPRQRWRWRMEMPRATRLRALQTSPRPLRARTCPGESEDAECTV